MKNQLIFVFAFVAFFVSGCASSVPTTTITCALTVGNETGNIIDNFEIISKDGQSVIPKVTDVSSRTKMIIQFPLIDGLNYIIAHQGGKVSKKSFVVKNGDIIELAGSRKFLDKVIFLPYDFKEVESKINY